MSYRKWVLAASLLLVAGIIAGIVNPAGSGLSIEDIAGLKELTKILIPGSAIMFVFILIKNVMALVISFAFSPIFCITPIITLLANGWLIGYISPGVIEQKSIGYVLVGILPHGIFEIPALVMAQSAALNFGAHTLMTVFKKRKGQPIAANFKYNVRYLVIALFLLVPAAIIETFLTPWLLKSIST
jgi:stage II sporulation protein M